MATATGATLSVVATATIPADDAAWKALSYVEVGEIASIGPLGDSHERVTVTGLKDGRVDSFPGSIDGGEQAVAINTENSGDAGQTVLRTANGTSNTVAVRIQDPGSVPAKYYLARIANYMEVERSPSVNQGATFTIWRTTAVQTIA